MTPPDVPAISSLAREIWQASYPGIITEQIDFMLEQRYGVDRLYDDLEDLRQMAGPGLPTGAIGFAFSEIYNGEFKLDKLYIHPDVQRQGWGLLIAKVAERAKKLGYPCVILAVTKRNVKASIPTKIRLHRARVGGRGHRPRLRHGRLHHGESGSSHNRGRL